MRNLALTVFTLLFFGSILLAQEPAPSDVHQQTTPPPNARFEIVQSEVTAKSTYRLDRFTGHVDLLVKSETEGYSWEDMPVTGLPRTVSPTKARFQLFTSGIAVRFTFLLDTDTGKSWIVVSDHTWQPFAEAGKR